ncbi:DNA topoisomerase IB [Actinomadura sp. HBU206391]|uniref:DNA topoisomerase IB n=1 Tax=Actinomadura sp. HBU206391 TaxID=2731692 RepID=UPI00165045EE|nr:DNA topoisomerase IB [Actinomadura sp. HBU206391]MBC6459898.1 DNA topoisomerase IB [Actinomadura sp. HBU206391]
MPATDATEFPDVPGLRRSDPEEPGFRRRRRGRGFQYLKSDGSPLRDATELARIKALVIPPAWTEVWICASEDGHLQAVGTDDAGRRQYRYHDMWREWRDREKHDRMLDFAAALPRVRERVTENLAGRGFRRERVLAAAVRLLDLGLFRAGGEEYAAQNGTYGLATVLREHVHCSGAEIRFDYLAKGAKQRVQAVAEESVCKVVAGLKRRRHVGQELLAYRDGPDWHSVRSGDINDYIRELADGDFTAKDFRTWHATVLAAVGLAVSAKTLNGSDNARRRAVARVVSEVADYLGNTPSVARASYIGPKIIRLFERGITIDRVLGELGAETQMGELATQGRAEQAVRRLLLRYQ